MNPVAKYLWKFNKKKVERDRKKDLKRNYNVKYKTRGYDYE